MQKRPIAWRFNFDRPIGMCTRVVDSGRERRQIERCLRHVAARANRLRVFALLRWQVSGAAGNSNLNSHMTRPKGRQICGSQWPLVAPFCSPSAICTTRTSFTSSPFACLCLASGYIHSACELAEKRQHRKAKEMPLSQSTSSLASDRCFSTARWICLPRQKFILILLELTLKEQTNSMTQWNICYHYSDMKSYFQWITCKAK